MTKRIHHKSTGAVGKQSIAHRKFVSEQHTQQKQSYHTKKKRSKSHYRGRSHAAKKTTKRIRHRSVHHKRGKHHHEHQTSTNENANQAFIAKTV
ncbi:hypothetical protein I4U23_003300 [Adineta vaga]|nr:hypothetical protein I4U23_003300 [Adineta vaga]